MPPLTLQKIQILTEDSVPMFSIRAIICHNYTLYALNGSNTSNNASCRYIFARVNVVSRESRQLQERASSIRKCSDTAVILPCQPEYSTILITYSRGSILPLAMCFSLAFAEPPRSIFLCSSCIRAKTSSNCLAFSWNWGADLLTFEGRTERAVA